MPRINALTKNEKRGELGTLMDDLVLLQQNRWDPKNATLWCEEANGHTFPV